MAPATVGMTAAAMVTLAIPALAPATASPLPLVDQTSTITAFAGTGVVGFTGDGGPAVNARINEPRDSDLGPDGSLYITDTFNHRIRRVAPDGTISTVVGTGASGYNGDNRLATEATIYWPHDVLVDDDGVMYIADSANHRIRRVGLDGVITTLAGTGKSGFKGDGGPATSAQFKNPKGLALFEDRLFVADGNNHRIRMVDLTTGFITTVAGSGARGYGGDNGPATSAQLNIPQRIDVDPLGRVYIADSDNHRIRRFTPGGTITTVAGAGVAGNTGDGGLATQARLRYPRGVGVAGTDVLYIADTGNHRVRRVDLATGIITTVVGTGTAGYSGDGGAAGDARVRGPRGVTVDPLGRLYVADTFNSAVRLVSPELVDLGPNTPPVAAFSVTCMGARCTFDASASNDPDGMVTGYQWDFGDGTQGVGRTVQHTYGSDGTFEVTLTVTDNRGDTDVTSSAAIAANLAPVAAFEASCRGLACTFDASTSSDPDGTLVDFAWDFGDGTVGSGATTSHSFRSEGEVTVTLTVTDHRGATGTSANALAVAPVDAAMEFRAAQAVGGPSSARPVIAIPSSVQADDTLLLFVSNGSSRTPSVPSGWNHLATRSDVELRTDVYWRPATAADSGSSVQVALLNASGDPQSAPNTLTVAAYSGVVSPPISAYGGTVEESSTVVFAHTTPEVTVPTAGSWVVSYWADRTSNTSNTSVTSRWAPPGGQQVRAEGYNTATGGRVTSLLTDDGATSVVGLRPGLTATANGQTKKATLWSIVLRGS